MSDSARRQGGNRRRVQLLAMAAALGLTAFTLTQCRVVPDNVTGIDFTSGRLSGRSACVKACNEAFKAAMQAENDAYKAATKACGQDQQCREAAKEAHKVREDGIKADKETCKKGCYNEGGGQGGR